MFIVRWEFTCRFGKVDDCISMLRRWEMDVGDRIGWKLPSVRVLAGFIGSNDSTIEFEARAENLTDLEGVFADMERNPHHREYMKQFEHLVVAGTSSWSVLREMKLIQE